MNVLSSICRAGSPSRPNEDASGSAGNAVWVIDGATGISPAPLIAGEGQTDASWLAGELNEVLARHALSFGPDLRGLLLAAQEDIGRAFRTGARVDYSDKADLPCCAVTILHVAEDCVRFAGISDTSVIVAGDGFVDGWAGDPLHHQADRDMVMRWQVLREEAGETNFSALLERIRPMIREQRRATNRKGTFGVFDPVSDISGHVVEKAWPAGVIDTALLMTDGFAALEQDYRLYDRSGLVNAARACGLEALYGELRAFEEGDAEAITTTAYK
ncbi:MAG: hypothetical protein EOM26_12535 [Alphaproteobacteria bacterium]|nr:hypothetical protein [Alphaproteobacteria bacterium]